MSNLTPEQIFNAFKKKELDRNLAITYLRTFVENSSSEELRLESLEHLSAIGVHSKEIFKILEHLLMSDSSELIQTKAALIIIKEYLVEGEEALKWTFDHESSISLIEIINALDAIDNERARALINHVEREIGKKYLELYDISSRDAIALEFIARKATDWEFERGLLYYISFKLNNKEIISLNLRQVDYIDSDILSLFPSLKELRMIDCFPGDLTGLENLTVLKISRFESCNLEHITDIKGLETLVNLEHLDLSRNYIPKINGLNTLTKLKELDLSQNSIKEINNLEMLTKLETLRLRNTRITQIKGLEKLINLKELDLSLDDNFDICIDEIKGLEKLINLESLNFAYNRLQKIKGLESLRNLKKLNLRGCEITEIKGLDSLHNLEILNLIFNQITEIKGLDSLKNLEILDLNWNQITEIKGLNSLINLKDLAIAVNQISEIKGLDSLKNLQKLNLQQNMISKVENLEKLMNLQEINLFFNKFPDGVLEGIKSDFRKYSQRIVKYGQSFVEYGQSFVNYCRQMKLKN